MCIIVGVNIDFIMSTLTFTKKEILKLVLLYFIGVVFFILAFFWVEELSVNEIFTDAGLSQLLRAFIAAIFPVIIPTLIFKKRRTANTK